MGYVHVENDEFFKYIFPIFRGIGLFILYIWLLSWNIYGWNRFKIDYKLVFSLKTQSNQAKSLAIKALIFTIFFFCMFLWYFINAIYFKEDETTDQQIKNSRNFLPKEYTPLIVWLLFVTFFLIPIKKVNRESTQFLLKTLKNCLFSPFQQMSFITSWTTDQFVSFVGPLKDLNYTFCFYIKDFTNKEDLDYCRSPQRFTMAFLMAALPLFLRMCQCLRFGYDQGKKVMKISFLNFVKYALALAVAILSYTTKLNQTYMFHWVLLAIVSTLYSYIWDLRMDWGLLQTNCKYKLLRENLAYPNIMFYYQCMKYNLLFRLAWVLSISPDAVMNLGMNPELMTFTISFLEMFRRCMWNCFIVEKEFFKIKLQLIESDDEEKNKKLKLKEFRLNKQFKVHSTDTEEDEDNLNQVASEEETPKTKQVKGSLKTLKKSRFSPNKSFEFKKNPSQYRKDQIHLQVSY